MSGRRRRLLAVTGGHSVDLAAFEAMVEAVCDELGWEWSHATQPEAQRWLHPDHAGRWDTILLHDLPGLRLARGAEPVVEGPDAQTRDGVRGLLQAGQGIVATHHALAGWPAWDEWADILGGRFFYTAGRLHGVDWPSSGYRMDRYRVDIVEPGHPVCAGVEPFEVVDELYLCPVHEADLVGLLATDADISPGAMISTYHEVRHGERRPANDQPPGSRLLGWVKSAAGSPLVYLLPGHGRTTMEHPQYRRLLGNAVAWVASDEARSWSPADRQHPEHPWLDVDRESGQPPTSG